MSDPTGAAWLTVSEAAAILKVSERTVRRRAERGKLGASRLETSDSGPVWLIEAAALEAAPTSPVLALDADQRPDAPPANTAEAADVARTGADSELLEELRAQVAFLRAQVENHARAEAELRAALREALKISTRALPSPDQEPPAAPPVVEADCTPEGPQTGTERPPRRRWRWPWE